MPWTTKIKSERKFQGVVDEHLNLGMWSNDMKKFLPSFIFSCLTVFSMAAYCNVYLEISLKEKVEKSSLVVIGKVVSTTYYDDKCMADHRCADVTISEVLKGHGKKEIRVVFDGPLSEANPLCCEVGASYLFFVTRVGENYYATVNGPYGIYKLP